MQMHFPVDRLKKQVSFVHVGIQTEMHLPNQENEQPTNCEGPAADRCAAVKLEPT